MEEIFPYSFAKSYALGNKFKTIRQYSEAVKAEGLSFHTDPKRYSEYTSAHEFLGYTKAEYTKLKCSVMVSNRDQSAVNAKIRATWAKNRVSNQETTGQLSLPKPTQLKAFTPEEVVDILVKSNASSEYIADFIKAHKVNSEYAVAVLIDLLKQSLPSPVTV